MSQNKTELLRNPYGETAYENFQKTGRAFVDKSSFIKELDANTSSYPVLLRPRRFGKSTFVWMLKCFYDISYQDRYEEIFSGTNIYREDLESHNSYHVLHFNFSGVSCDDKESLARSFKKAVTSGINDFVARYPDFVYDSSENSKNAASDIFKSFMDAYKRYPSKTSLYVMIDEYDNFANSVLSNDLGLFKTITSSGGLLKDFYASLKEGSETCIAKIFITGVSSVSLDSLTSGFNIARNVTSRTCFNSYAGFSEEELAELIPKLVDTDKIGASAEEIIARMKPVYDGYCFSPDAEHTMFNSSMSLYYLDEVRAQSRFLAPEDYMDPASDQDGKKLKDLFEIAEYGLADSIINSYLSGAKFFIKNLAENINLNKSAKYDRVQLLSMLYYLGYLTIDRDASDASTLALKIPNLFMSKLFGQCAAKLRLKPNKVFSETELDISAILDASDDLSGFASSCTEFFSAVCNNHVLSGMTEMALNLALFTKLQYREDVLVVEMQKSLRISGDGEKFADLVVTVNKATEDECVYVFELKYLSKAKYSDDKLQTLIKNASAQVLRYKSSIDFKNKNVKAFAMVFVGTDCKYCEIQN